MCPNETQLEIKMEERTPVKQSYFQRCGKTQIRVKHKPREIPRTETSFFFKPPLQQIFCCLNTSEELSHEATPINKEENSFQFNSVFLIERVTGDKEQYIAISGAICRTYMWYRQPIRTTVSQVSKKNLWLGTVSLPRSFRLPAEFATGAVDCFR